MEQNRDSYLHGAVFLEANTHSIPRDIRRLASCGNWKFITIKSYMF
jgi:hypothetical protein